LPRLDDRNDLRQMSIVSAKRRSVGLVRYRPRTSAADLTAGTHHRMGADQLRSVRAGRERKLASIWDIWKQEAEG